MSPHWGSVRLVHITTVPVTLHFLIGHVKCLQENGYDVHVISSPEPDLHRFRERTGVNAHGIRMQRRISPADDLRALASLTSMLRRLKPDIVHAHTPKAGLLGMLAARLAGVPVRVYHVHGFPFVTKSGWRRNILVWAERVACGFAHQVYSVSHSIARVAEEEGVSRAGRIRVLGKGSIGGVDATGRFAPEHHSEARVTLRRGLGIPESASVIGYVGRIVRDKGVEQLAEAWADVRQNSDAHLIIVGEDEPQDPISSEARAVLEGDPRVHFTGPVTDTAQYYSTMDIVTLPSFREGLPVVLLEAAAMALPVVATRIPGCVDAVVDGITGTLIPPGNAAALSQALLQYLEDLELARQHGAQGRAHVLRNFDPARIQNEMLGEYRRLLRLHARGM